MLSNNGLCLHAAAQHVQLFLVPYFTVEVPMSNKRPPPILAKKSCVGLIALELAPNYWFKGESDVDEMGDPFSDLDDSDCEQ